jgi:hypothetical protein
MLPVIRGFQISDGFVLVLLRATALVWFQTRSILNFGLLLMYHDHGTLGVEARWTLECVSFKRVSPETVPLRHHCAESALNVMVFHRSYSPYINL